MKTCLVLEGGGLRGIYTAGVLDELFKENIKIDAIIGVSMGSLVGINYVSRQPERTIRYNLKYCKDRRYIGLYSLLKTGNIANKEFAYYELPNKLDKFDYDTFKKSSIKFYCIVSNLDTGKAEYIKITDAKKQAEYLRAGSSMPGVSRIVNIDNNKYLDGGITDSIPFNKAIELGYDKIIVVTTRVKEYRKKKSKNKTLARIYKKYPNFVKAIEKRNENYNKSVEELIKLENKNQVFVIRPSSVVPIKRIEKNKKVIEAQYNLGKKDFKNKKEELIEYLQKKEGVK